MIKHLNYCNFFLLIQTDEKKMNNEKFEKIKIKFKKVGPTNL
jgi:hypothetical protein